MPSPFSPPLDAAELEAALPGVRVLRTLGVGGQGVAVEADVHGIGRAAVKVYGSQTVASRVDREIDKLRRLASGHVVRLYNHGQASLRGELCRFAVMEFVDGQEASSLVGKLDDGEVDGEVRRLLVDIAAGIGDLWALRVVHRDIKPANIMRRSDGTYVVLDLGLAKHLGEPTLTQLGFTCGTLGYMSPEQAAARRGLTLRSDLFALGILAYEVASGLHPYLRRQELVGQIAVRPLHSVRPAVSSAVSEVVGRLLQPNPLARPSRLDDVVALLA
jgi:serine/threonine protein kinase